MYFLFSLSLSSILNYIIIAYVRRYIHILSVFRLVLSFIADSPYFFHIVLVILPLRPTHMVRYLLVLSPQDNQGTASLSDSPSCIHIHPFHRSRDNLPSTTLQTLGLRLHIKSSLAVSSMSTPPVLQNRVIKV